MNNPDQPAGQAGPEWRAGLHKRLRQQFDRLRALEPRFAVRDESESAWAVGQHVHHLGLAASSMMLSLLTGRMWQGTPAYPELKERVLDKGRIPSGQSKAPAAVSPDTLPESEEIVERLEKARTRVESVMNDEMRSPTMVHPVLGQMSSDEALRFIEVHNDHHLRIIDRILGRSD